MSIELEIMEKACTLQYSIVAVYVDLIDKRYAPTLTNINYSTQAFSNKCFSLWCFLFFLCVCVRTRRLWNVWQKCNSLSYQS